MARVLAHGLTPCVLCLWPYIEKVPNHSLSTSGPPWVAIFEGVAEGRRNRWNQAVATFFTFGPNSSGWNETTRHGITALTPCGIPILPERRYEPCLPHLHAKERLAHLAPLKIFFTSLLLPFFPTFTLFARKRSKRTKTSAFWRIRDILRPAQCYGFFLCQWAVSVLRFPCLCLPMLVSIFFAASS